MRKDPKSTELKFVSLRRITATGVGVSQSSSPQRAAASGEPTEEGRGPRGAVREEESGCDNYLVRVGRGVVRAHALVVVMLNYDLAADHHPIHPQGEPDEDPLEAAREDRGHEMKRVRLRR